MTNGQQGGESPGVISMTPARSPDQDIVLFQRAAYQFDPQQQQADRCSENVRHALLAVYPRNTAKEIARDISIPQKRVEKWLNGEALPNQQRIDQMASIYGAQFICNLFAGQDWTDLLQAEVLRRNTAAELRRLADMVEGQG